jgi:hypothetical protein
MKIRQQTTEKDAVVLTHAEATTLRIQLYGVLRAREMVGATVTGNDPIRELHDLLKGAGR